MTPRTRILRARALTLLALALGPVPSAAAQVAPAPNSPAVSGGDVIAVVDGLPIREFEWERLAGPYFKEIEGEAGRPLRDEERMLLRKNVLHELIRERLWIADAKRRGMTVMESQVEARMRQSEFFKTDGKFDEAKYLAFKQSPVSNYPAVRAQLELGLLLEQYQRWMERRFGPREAELRQEFRTRTLQATLRYFVLGPDAVSLDPEAGAKEIRAYYDAHPDEFRAAAEARIQYVKVPSQADPAAGDSAREAAAAAGLRAARELLAAIRAGAPAETGAKVYGGFHDSGTFRLGEPIRGLGRSDALTEAVRATEAGAWLPDPIRVGPFHVVARVLEKRAPRAVPFQEAVSVAKRKADAAIRDAYVDSLAREEIARHPEAYLRPRLVATVVARPLAAFEDPKSISANDVEKALKRARKEAGVSDTARSWLDSVRTTLPAALGAERRARAAFQAMRDIVRDLERGRSGAEVAAKRDAAWSRVALYRGEPPAAPSLAEGAFLDSLYDLRPGRVLGPRVARDSIFAARLDSLDPGFRPPYDTVRSEARSAALTARRLATERDADTWFAEHRDRYLTPVRYVFDLAAFAKPPADTAAVTPDSIAAYYAAHPVEFTEVARARVRHILVAAPASESARMKDAARQKALQLRERVVRGADFAEVAKEASDDKGSAARGGDLGELIRSQLVPEFGAVAFSIPVGQVSEPILTQYGYHLVRVDERTPQRLRPLEECASEIRKVLAEDLADSLALHRAWRAIAVADDSAAFAAAVAPAGGARRFGPLAESDRVGDLGVVAGLGEWLRPVPPGAVTPQPWRTLTHYLVARKIREAEPAPAPFAEVKDRVIADYEASRRRAIADERNAKMRQAVAAGADLDSLFVPYGGLRPSKPFGRSGPIPDLARDPALGRDSLYLERVFASKPGSALPPLAGASGTLYAKVDAIAEPAASDFAKRREELRRELLEQRIAAWTDRLRSRATVVVRRPDLQGLEN